MTVHTNKVLISVANQGASITTDTLTIVVFINLTLISSPRVTLIALDSAVNNANSLIFFP